MFGGGGFPGGFEMPGGMGGRGPSKSDSTRYYKILGVDQNASEAELKKAHRKLALRLHPDKGGDPDKFKEINEAYDCLKDPEKRKIYDQYGEDAIKEGMGSGGGGGGGMSDLFDILSGGGGRRASRQERKGENVVHRLRVTLDEMYNGASRKLSLSRNIKCSTCDGTRSKSGAQHVCDTCGGQGVRLVMRHLGPGMMQQLQQACDRCGGKGYSIPPGDQCPSCSGKGLVSEKKVFDVHIEQGHMHNSKVVLRGEAGLGNDPSISPGDVVFVLEMRPHATFQRVHHDLIMEKDITLQEALCGATFQVQALDKRVLHVATEQSIITPGDWKCIQDEGMPVHGRPFEKGNLYIHFNVIFPKSLSSPTRTQLASILPGGASSNGFMDTDNAEHVSLRPVKDFKEEMAARRQFTKTHGGAAYDSSDEEEGGGRGGQRVQCAQQ